MNDKTTAGDSSWRDKYLSVLDEQERQQRLFTQQQELLRKALARVSLAAEGLDYQLDGELEQMRDALRQPSTKVLQQKLDGVDDAVRAFESRRGQRSEILLTAFCSLVKQLQDLSIPREVAGGLKKYQRGLKARITHLQQYPNLLEELAQLQQQVLDTLGVSKPSLWQRFTGSADKAEQPEVQTKAPPEPEAEKIELDTPQEAIVTEGDQGLVIEGQFDQLESDVAAGDAASSPEAIFQRPVHEPAFSKISDKITVVLSDFLEHVEPVECVVQKVKNARERIDRGLNWFELVPTLEDIRDLVMQAYLAADNAFVTYLDQVNAELEVIYAALGGAVQSEAAVRDAGNILQRRVDDQVASLQQAVATSDTLAQLKSQVNGQIDAIRDALQHYRQDPSIDQAPLAEQLQSLVQRVQAMEADAQRHKDNYEEQRRKALQDALTGLPNREAYSERAHHEFQRWQRYGHPLTLAVCDIDFFKKINDSYGHQAGDRVLKVISKAIFKRLREVDFMARYGGEEFVILLPETPADNALRTLDKIREALASTPFHFKEQPVQITLSIGVSEFDEGDNVETVFARADKALYRAKDSGRNRCEMGRTSL